MQAKQVQGWTSDDQWVLGTHGLMSLTRYSYWEWSWPAYYLQWGQQGVELDCVKQQ